MKTFRLLLAGVAAALLLGGCGGSGDKPSETGGPTAKPRPQEARFHLTLGLNGIPGPETAGIMLADQRGCDRGLAGVGDCVVVGEFV